MKRMTVSRSDEIQALRDNSYFKGLEEVILNEIAMGMSLIQFDEDELIFWDGEPCSGLHFIRSGSVKLFKLSPWGRELIIQIFGPGVTFNEVSVFDGGMNPVNVAALEKSEIWIIDPRVIRDAVQKYPTLAASVINNLSANLRMLVIKVEELSFYQVTHRLARLIESLPDEILMGDASSRLTQDQMAARVGTVREVIGRSLKELEKSGAIKVSRGRIEITNSDILQNWSSITDN